MPTKIQASESGERSWFDRSSRHANSLPGVPVRSIRLEATPAKRRNANVPLGGRRMHAGRTLVRARQVYVSFEADLRASDITHAEVLATHDGSHLEERFRVNVAPIPFADQTRRAKLAGDPDGSELPRRGW